MTEAVFAADPARLLIAAATGIVLLLLLIIKFKIHPVLSLLISALVIGLGAGMPVPTLVNTVEKGAGETLQGDRFADWSWFAVWRHTGSIRRCSVCCTNADQSVWRKKGRHCPWNHRTNRRYDCFL